MLYNLYIEIDSVYTLFTPNLENCIIRKSVQENQCFSRVTVEGEMFFKGAEYDILKTKLATNNKLNAYITVQGADNIVGFINLLGKYSILENTCNLQFVVTDEYTNLMNGYDTMIDIPVDNVNELLIQKNCRYSTLDSLPVLGHVTKYYGRGLYSLKNLVEYIVTGLDFAVVFDNDSFSYLDSKGYTNVHLATLENFLLSTDEYVKTFQLSFEKLMSIFSNFFNMMWKLEYVSGNWTFRLIHKSEINYTLGSNIDLTSYKGVNYSKDKANFEYTKESRFYRLFRNVPITKALDYKGKDIVIPSLINLELTKTIQVNCLADVEDILRNNPTKYQDLGTDFYILSDNYTIEETWQNSQESDIKLKLEDTSVIHDPKLTISYIDNATIGFLEVFINTDCPEGVWMYMPPFCDTDGFDDVLPIPSGKHIFVDLLFDNRLGVPDFPTEVQIQYLDFETVDGVVTNIPAYPTTPIVLTDFGTFSQDYYLNSNTSGAPTGLALFIKGVQGNAFTLRGISPADRMHYATFKQDKCIKDYGIFEDTTILDNVRLGIAKLDDNFMNSKLPDTPAIINDVSTTVTVEKKFKSDGIRFPNYSHEIVNFEELISTDLGDIEIKDLTVRMNGEMSELTGNF